MKKIKKSKQARAVTFLVGAIIPKFFCLSSFAVLNKLIWKGLSQGAFAIATYIVGLFYSFNIISGRKAGGKTRIVIFLILMLALGYLAPFIAGFIIICANIIAMILILTIVGAISYLIYKLVKWIIDCKHKKANCNVVDKGNEPILNNNIIINREIESNSSGNKSDGLQPTKSIDTTIQDTPKKIAEYKSKATTLLQRNKIVYYTIYELAWQHDFNSGCLTVTNNVNQNLKWIKIYKSYYANGKFYGYIKMNNARHTVSGEIYYADQPIWYLV